jgi:plastocyanin
MPLLRPVLAVTALVALLLAGCASSGPSVTLRDNRFDPGTLTVAAGTSVHFTNAGQNTHTVTIHSPDGIQVFDKILKPGDSTSYNFPGKGGYHVFCQFHDTMEMAVTAT